MVAAGSCFDSCCSHCDSSAAVVALWTAVVAIMAAVTAVAAVVVREDDPEDVPHPSVQLSNR